MFLWIGYLNCQNKIESAFAPSRFNFYKYKIIACNATDGAAYFWVAKSGNLICEAHGRLYWRKSELALLALPSCKE